MKDYHVHSGMLDHTKDDIETISRTAKSLGLKEIAFTEHFNWELIENPKPKNVAEHDTLYHKKSKIPKDGRKTTTLEDYFDKIEKIRKLNSIKIWKGLEVDYFDIYEEKIKKSLNKHSIEIVLGRCHHIVFDDFPEKKIISVKNKEDISSFVEKFGKEELYNRYFMTLLKAVRSGIFNYIVHLDIIRKHAPFDRNFEIKKASQYLEVIFNEMIKEDVGLEINIGGMRRKEGLYPLKEFILLYKKKGGKKLSIGSDSHSKEELIKSIKYLKKAQSYL